MHSLVKGYNIRKVLGHAITKAFDKTTYIDCGVVLITEDFEYMVDIEAKDSIECKELINILKQYLN